MPNFDINKDEVIAYAWPGGYPVYYICADNGVLCFECTNTEALVKSADPDYRDDDQWRVIANEINWEDPQLQCDNCYKRIESAYAEDEALSV